MCGICLAHICNTTSGVSGRQNFWAERIGGKAESAFHRRGPDSMGFWSHQIGGNEADKEGIGGTGEALHCAASVLHIRGAGGTETCGGVTVQPVVDDQQTSMLMFNGEIYGGLPGLTEHLNDTTVLFDHLKQVSGSGDIGEMVSLLAALEGPFAMVFYDSAHKSLWFCRDAFGRRSLLWGKRNVGDIDPPPQEDSSSGHNFAGYSCNWALSSIAIDLSYFTWSELPAGFIFRLDFSSSNNSPISNSSTTEISNQNRNHNGQLWAFQIRPTHQDAGILAELESSFRRNLRIVRNFELDTKNLFRLNREVGISTDFGKVDLSMDDDIEELFESWYLGQYQKEVDQFIHHLRTAVRKRIRLVPEYCQNCSPKNCRHNKIALLFSGGVDSLLLAVLIAEEFGEGGVSIDLLNVAFGDRPSQAPDRLTGENAYRRELCRLFPRSCRKWKFVKIDVTTEELAVERRTRIAKLIHPSDTVLDDSVGCVLWFAARGVGEAAVSADADAYLDADAEMVAVAELGVGTDAGPEPGIGADAERDVVADAEPEPRIGADAEPYMGADADAEANYVCKSRVVLLGSGADELLSGYSRHRKRYTDVVRRRHISNQMESEPGAGVEAESRQALIDELEMELLRLGSRNLARDDRMVSDHGRESRLPYLDEQFVRYVNGLPLEAKVDLRRRRGLGEKLILRMALRRLGVKREFYRLPKRAMQFGTRIAKAENRAEKGQDRCGRLNIDDDGRPR